MQCRGALQLENKPHSLQLEKAQVHQQRAHMLHWGPSAAKINTMMTSLTYLIHLILNLKNDPPPKKKLGLFTVI